MALTELLLHPQILAKAQKGLDDVIPASSAIVSEADISKLKYLVAIVKETLRKHPPAPLMVPRESTAECKRIQCGRGTHDVWLWPAILPGYEIGNDFILANLLYKLNWRTTDGKEVDVGFTLMRARPLALVPLLRK
ncbi:cytochrome P450 76C1 [Selaginella moellendorffii]|uniref:cytochrome P450 76C1 n=1 Tax=Selaginella moellendorffii TaxID=88036 RepID=UPI000D1C3BCB|nr:cytochrome P450 76C1 [Selaginella moellendorffii]|eukprot:XP_024531149.1 cytochrome P450 76C1 [Selaginella moellendorffii]